MGAKVKCKKGYGDGTKDGCVEFKKAGEQELCPVSDVRCCEECKAKKFAYE